VAATFAFTISAFVTFFTIIDPIGLAPIVVGLTAQFPTAQRNQIVTRAVIISALIIAFFGLVGRFLLDRLGIGLYAFNIAGGALLFLVAVDMLFGRQSGARETKEEEAEALTRVKSARKSYQSGGIPANAVRSWIETTTRQSTFFGSDGAIRWRKLSEKPPHVCVGSRHLYTVVAGSSSIDSGEILRHSTI
jgi:MarC family integral membrane protein